MNTITLKRIDESNFIDCFNLKLAMGQEKYVSNPVRSLAQAYVYYNQCVPFGIYAEDTMVGYVMVIYDYDEEVYNIWHMMIDRAFQKRGYGKSALQEVLKYIASKPFGSSKTILITCNPKKNWLYDLFYKPWKENTLKDGYAFVQALVQDNPFATEDYINTLRNTNDKVTKERLYFGNWEYDDDPAVLCGYDAICDLFTNEHVKPVGESSGSADLAMKGRDRFVAGHWKGNVCYIKIDQSYSEGRTIEADLKRMMIECSIPRSMLVADSDGLGAYLESYLNGIKEFHGGNRPVNPEFDNLKSECAFKLAEMINNRQIRVVCSDAQGERIKKELSVLKQDHVDADTRKKGIISKEKMKETLGHSPDYLDMLIMAMVFRIRPVLKRPKAKLGKI